MKGKAFQSKNVRALFLMLDRLVEAQSLPPAVLIVFSIVEHLELLSITLSDTVPCLHTKCLVFRRLGRRPDLQILQDVRL